MYSANVTKHCIRICMGKQHATRIKLIGICSHHIHSIEMLADNQQPHIDLLDVFCCAIEFCAGVWLPVFVFACGSIVHIDVYSPETLHCLCFPNALESHTRTNHTVVNSVNSDMQTCRFIAHETMMSMRSGVDRIVEFFVSLRLCECYIFFTRWYSLIDPIIPSVCVLIGLYVNERFCIPRNCESTCNQKPKAFLFIIEN